MLTKETEELLNQAVDRYNRPGFICSDPISIPHSFEKKEDIEIAGFLAATFSWGQRKTIISKGFELMGLMDNSPFDFLSEAPEEEFIRFIKFAHRTFNDADCLFFLASLRNIYKNHYGMESLFTEGYIKNCSIGEAISHFRCKLFEIPHLDRSEKHFSDPSKNSASKRINMFLRWMVRNDDKGVDFGIWKSISPARLLCPLDLHSGRVARRLGLLTRKQDDWRAVEELTANLRLLDPLDPVKYDFALFGLGIFEKFSAL